MRLSLPPRFPRRLGQLLIGLWLYGWSMAMLVHSELGLDPWDVLHQGISDRTGIPIGTVSVLVSFVVILGWIPLRQRLGLGTVLNAILIGSTMDVVIPLLPDPSSTAQQWALLALGLVIAGPGIGMYIGARLGPGPRDGIMTGLAERGPSIRLVRTGIELTALAAGWVLGGTIGIGTVLFAVTVGPNVQFWLHKLDLGYPPGFERVTHPDGHHAEDPPPDVEPDFTISGS